MELSERAGISSPKKKCPPFLKLFDERGDEEGIRIKFDRLAQAAGHSSEWADEVVSPVNRLMELDR